jgi:hypothetical protein
MDDVYSKYIYTDKYKDILKFTRIVYNGTRRLEETIYVYNNKEFEEKEFERYSSLIMLIFSK